MHRSILSALLLIVTTTACSTSNDNMVTDDGGAFTASDGAPGTIDGLKTITITPPDPTLDVTTGTPATLAFTASGKFTDGHSEDITARVGWDLDNVAVGSFTGAKLTAYGNAGGTVAIYARSGTLMGTTTLSLVLHATTNDPGSTNIPANPATKFSGSPVAARAPDVVYPADGTLVPPNLGRLEIHFMPGMSNTLFELDFTNTVTKIAVYLRCTNPTNGGCIYLPPPAVWEWISATNRGGLPLAITVKGTDDAGSAYGVSTPIKLSFAHDDINGGIYYWTTSGATGIMRFDFASSSQTTAESFLPGGDALINGTSCVGCHALSRDGSKLVAEVNGQGDGRDILLDVAMDKALVSFPSTQKSIFEAWAPDGSQYVGVCGPDGCSDDMNLLLIDGATGALTGTIDVGATDKASAADHPDWSPDGNSIAFTKIGASPNSLQRMFRGSIGMVSRSGASWGTAVTLVPSVDGKNHYYPSFSPDNSVIVYDESTCPAGTTSDTNCDADSDPSARLWMIPPHVGSTPVELAKANAPGKMDGSNQDLTSSFPRWSPFVFQRSNEFGSKVEWLTFSSTRRLGLRKPPNSTMGGENPLGAQLWMVAVDPTAAQGGADPSYPAFFLPFQDPATSNHIAQWTTSVPGHIGRSTE